MIKKIFVLCFMVFQLQALDIFQAVEMNDKLAVRQWLKFKSNVDLLNDQGQSLLHVAVQAGNKSVVKHLLSKKIDVNIVDQFGKTALDYAVELQRDGIVLLLVKRYAKIANAENSKKLKIIINKRNNRNQFIAKVLQFPFTCLKILTVAAVIIGIPLGIVLALTVDPIFILVGGFGAISLFASYVYTLPFTIVGKCVATTIVEVDDKTLTLSLNL